MKYTGKGHAIKIVGRGAYNRALNKALRANQAVEKARARRVEQADERALRTRWFIEQVSKTTNLSMSARVRLATEYLKNQVVLNISTPVERAVVRTFTKIEVGKILRSKGLISLKEARKKKDVFVFHARTRVTKRSKPGEYPRADTTRLMKDIFSDYIKYGDSIHDGIVGTTLDYGVILELSRRLHRGYLVKTLVENQGLIKKILTIPITNGEITGSGIELNDN